MFLPFHFLSLHSMSMTVATMFLVLTLKMNFLKKKGDMFLAMVVFVNFFSLIPYSLCVTCYVWNNFILATVLMASVLIKINMLKFNVFLSQLLPYASPAGLWDILFWLELLSFSVRPLTLSLRLTCNLLTGHVLLYLVSELSLVFVLLTLFFYFFEMAVSMIQGHVFALLFASYSLE